MKHFMQRVVLKSLAGATLLLSSALWARSASAQTGKIDLQTEAPPAPVARSYHVHDGFYLRANLGLGGLSTSYDLGADEHVDAGGVALDLDLLVGGSPSPGLAIGGGLLTSTAPSAGFEWDETDLGDGRLNMVLLGVFVDGFPNPKRGFHLGGLLGVAGQTSKFNSDGEGLKDTYETAGFGGAAWIGYDWWVAAEWSMGLQFRLAGAISSSEDDDVDAAAFNSSLMFTTVYH